VWDWNLDSLPESLGRVSAHIAGFKVDLTQTEDQVALEVKPAAQEVLLAVLHLVPAASVQESSSITLHNGLPVYLASSQGPRPLTDLASLVSKLAEAFGYSPWITQYYLYRASQLTPTEAFPAPVEDPVTDETMEAFNTLGLRSLID